MDARKAWRQTSAPAAARNAPGYTSAVTAPAPGQPPSDNALERIVAELCALQGLQLGPGDPEAVAAIYGEYLRLIDEIKAAPLDVEATPALHLDISRPTASIYPGLV
jgi:hypothetical protein